MVTRILGWVVFLGLALAGAAGALAGESVCVKCHTDEATLKSLFTPPKLAAEEGEG